MVKLTEREKWLMGEVFANFSPEKYDRNFFGDWLKEKELLLLSFAPSEWVVVNERLPNDETPVLILHRGIIKVGELVWDNPSWEDTYKAFRYWDDPVNDGQDWEWFDVTHWMPLPPAPPKEEDALEQSDD